MLSSAMIQVQYVYTCLEWQHRLLYNRKNIVRHMLINGIVHIHVPFVMYASQETDRHAILMSVPGDTW